MIDDTVDLFLEPARAKGRDLLCFVPSVVTTDLIGNAGRVRQVLTNLLANAIKFTSSGEVELSVTAEGVAGGQVLLRFDVRDTGIGIPPEKQIPLFDALAQADVSTTPRFGGTGLGLSIAKQLCEMMDGSIGVISRPGQGSTFWFIVRLAVQPVMQVCGTSTGQPEDLRHRSAAKPMIPDVPASPLPMRSREFAGSRVLLAEDNEVNREVACGMLEAEGCEMATACNGVEALRLCETAAFDIILMDCQMPEMDGFTATAALRAQEQGTLRHTPIVALTANALLGDRENCLAAGMDDYLTRPFARDAIRAVLARWVEAKNTVPDAEMTNGIGPVDIQFEPRALDELRAIDHAGVGGLVAGIIDAFLPTTPAAPQRLGAAAAARDLPALRAEGHSLKSSCAAIGAVGIAARCAALEAAARVGRTVDDNTAVREIKESYRHVVPLVSTHGRPAPL